MGHAKTNCGETIAKEDAAAANSATFGMTHSDEALKILNIAAISSPLVRYAVPMARPGAMGKA
jgi:hypothetical protein